MKMENNRRLVIASNRLPFKLIQTGNDLSVKESDGGLVSALKSYFQLTAGAGYSEVIWVGVADFDLKKWLRFKGQNQALTYTMSPIFEDKKLYSKYYNGFCNSTIWPLFHYFPSFAEFDTATFEAFEKVNNAFADHLAQLIQPDDTVWIHDYQLMLLPGLLRARFPNLKIGFFLHIPFPAYDLFRMLLSDWKRKIIQGMLGADLVGFHTSEYADHFIRSVQMLTGYEYRYRYLLLSDRRVRVNMFPIGIDFDKFHNGSTLPEVSEIMTNVRSTFHNTRIIFSVDRLDYTKGITHRLYGYEKFLEMHPDWIGQVVFIMVVVPSREFVSRYNERKQLIEEQIGRINGRYSTLQWQPIIYRYNHLSFHELSGLYNVADVALITPLRDGMNLVAKEYLASRKDTGVLILSELAGASHELGEAIRVNPMDREEVANALLSALTMPSDVQEAKIRVLQDRLRKFSVTHWVNDFLQQLDAARSEAISPALDSLSKEEVLRIKMAFESSRQRLVLLDYDGTLVKFSQVPDEARPTPQVLELLTSLSADPRTHVAIVSGRDHRTLHNWFHKLPVTLVSEHGAGIRPRGKGWNHFSPSDQSWKKDILPVLRTYCDRSPGSFIEEKVHTLVWHYRAVDADLGIRHARELRENLLLTVRNTNLQVLNGNKVIEVRVSGVNKGIVTADLRSKADYDFVLAIGDDVTDEDMFAALPEESYSIKVGSGSTIARGRLSDPDEVGALLKVLDDSWIASGKLNADNMLNLII